MLLFSKSDKNFFQSKLSLTKCDDSVRSKTFSQYLFTMLAQQPANKLALIDYNTGIKLSYSELHLKFQEVAMGLARSGFTKDDLVLFFGFNTVQYVFTVFGLTYLGVAISLVDPTSDASKLAFQILNSQATAIVIDKPLFSVLLRVMDNEKNEKQYENLMKKIKLLVLLNLDHDEKRPDQLIEHHNKPQHFSTYEKIYRLGRNQKLNLIPFYWTFPTDNYLIAYTSDTIDLPNGVVHSQNSWLASLIGLREGQTMGERTCMSLPIGNTFGFLGIGCTWISGGCIAFSENFCFEDLFQSISKYSFDTLYLFADQAAMLAEIVEQNEFNLSPIKKIVYVKEKSVFSRKLTENWPNLEIRELYAAIEYSGGIVNYGSAYETHPESVGILTPNCELKIIDLKDSTKALSFNEIGKICLRGPPMFIKYLDDKKAAKKFIDSQGWFHTNDVGFVDDSGGLHLKKTTSEPL